MDEVATSNEPIEADIPIGELRKQPFSLPAGFQWDTLKIDEDGAIIKLKSFTIQCNEK